MRAAEGGGMEDKMLKIKQRLCMLLTLAVTAGILPAATVRAESSGYGYYDFDSVIDAVQITAENNSVEAAAVWAENDDGYTYKDGGCIGLNASGSEAYARIEADYAEPYIISDDYMVFEYKFKTDAFNGKNFYIEFKLEDDAGNSGYAQAVFIDNYDFLNAVRNKTLKSMQGLENTWVHVLLRLNKTYCEVYVNGEMYGPVAMRTVVGKYTKISGFRLGDCVWSTGKALTTYYDEIYAYPCTETELVGTGVIGDELVLDFNNPIDIQSGAISVKRGGVFAETTVALDPIDPTRIRILTDGSNGEYTVEYSGITDVWGGAADGNVSISKTAVLKPTDAEEDDDISWKDNSDNGCFVLHEFNTASAISSISTGLSRSDTITHMYDISARWPTKSVPNITINFGTAGSKEYDVTQYGYLNIWFYSEKATGSTINVVVYSNGATSNYQTARFDVDWEGWRLLAIPVSSISNVVGNPDMTKAFRLVFNSTGWGVTNASEECILYFERVWFSKNSPVEAASFASAESPYGMDNMPVKNAAAVLEFDKPLFRVASAAIIDGEGKEVKAQAEISGTKLRVIYPGCLLPDTEYTVKISGLWDVNANEVTDIPDVKFTTIQAGLSASVPKFYDNASQKYTQMPVNGDISAYTVAENLGDETIEAAVTVVVYNSDGSVDSIKTETAELLPGEKKNIYATVNSGDYTDKFALAFVSDTTGAQKLAGAVYSTLGTENISEVTEYKTALHLNDLTIAGNIDIKEKRTVLVKMTDRNGELCLIRPTVTDAAGNWAVAYTFNPTTAAGGDYAIEVSAYGIDYQKSESIYYAAAAERDALLEAVNAASNSDSIKSMVVKSASALELDEAVTANSAAVDNICLTLIEQKPYSEFSELVEAAHKAIDTLAELNECNWSQLTEFLEKNEIVISRDNSYYVYYTGMNSDKSRQTINQKVMEKTPFSGFESFRSAFETEVKKIKNTQSSSQGQSGGGGSSGTSIGAVSAPIQTAAPEKTEIEFEDISLAEWARVSVMYLYNRNIVAMPEERLFRPNDSITREEFVKLLVMALGEFDENAQADFADVEQGAWYAPYVASAKNAGIAAGDDSGCFGVGRSITREDMAAMIYRAAGSRLSAEQTASFIDADEISDYAKESVTVLANAGIINGIGDGRFAPKDTATRAQAAVIIYGLMTK